MNVAEVLTMAALLAPGAERAGDAPAIAAAIADTVTSARERLYDEKTDAALLLVYAWRESSFRLQAVGDAGRARGAWQLWAVPEAVAFNAHAAARVWYSLALAGAAHDPLCPLKSLSGGGSRGARIAAMRTEAAKKLVEGTHP